MTQFSRFGIILLTCVIAANCGGGGTSPTAASPVASTQTPAPTPTPSPTPTPTPTAANVTGAWTQSGSLYMTLTQDGTTVTGTLAQFSVEFGGITSVFSGAVTGSTSGANVSLSFLDTITARAGTEVLVCRGTDTFTGTQSGNTLSGTYTPSPSGYLCDGGIPLPVPTLPSGPIIFIRQ